MFTALLTNEQAILLGNAVKAFRTVRNLTQQDLARAGTVSKNQVYLLEAGKATNVRQQTLVMLSDAMQLNNNDTAHLMRLAGFDTPADHYEPLNAQEFQLIQQLRQLGPDVAQVIYDSVQGIVINRNRS